MYLREYGIEVDAVGQCGAEGDVDDIGEFLCDRREIVVVGSLSEFLDLLLNQALPDGSDIGWSQDR
jgi:hypothetical protein